jgi:hypothetical protein
MPFRAGARRWVAGSGLIVILLSLACTNLKITNLPEDTVALLPVATAVSAALIPTDIAVSAIDVEKPAGRPTSDSVVLLAVVENKGTEPASQIQVEGRLYDGTGKDLLLKKTESIPRLAAGESKVVRFRATEPLPLRDGYLVRVEAIPLPGELSLSNNNRVFRAQVQIAAGH